MQKGNRDEEKRKEEGHWLNEQSIRQSSWRPGFNPRSNHTKTQKVVFDAALPNTQHYKVRLKGKVKQSWEWSSALLYTSV